MHDEFGVSNDARRVQVFVGGQRTIDLIAGGRTVDYVGIFVRRAGDDTVYALRGELAEPLRRPREDWRDKRIVTVDADSVAAIEIRHGRRSVVARRDGPTSGSWTLGNGQPADRGKIDLMLREYGPLMAAGFANPAQARALDFTSPKARARFVSHSGRVLADVVFDSTEMAMWARTADGVEIFRVNPWMWSRLVPPL